VLPCKLRRLTVQYEQLYRNHYGRLLAGMIRLARDVDVAEDALQEAFAAAIVRQPSEDPNEAAGWIFSTARHKVIDRFRKQAFEAEHESVLAELEEDRSHGPAPEDPLRLFFTCCHPALDQEAQSALTLRTLAGLSTEEIARAFLVSPTTMAQRLVRAKSKIRDAGIPYAVPEDDVLGERVDGVMATLYLVFHEGYSATFGDALVRRDLCTEAIRLGRMLRELLPKQAEPRALLALMLLHDSRRDTRQDAGGALVRLEDQDRARWDRAQIAEGAALVEDALRAGVPGSYALQAAIAALHAQAARAADTDWPQIVGLYALLYRIQPTPIVELNRAVAIAMADGPEHGLALIDQLEAGGHLAGYYLVPAARAALLARLGRRDEAARCYEQAVSLTTNDAERRFLEGELRAARGTRN
jgi:RNA polymerase sigma-70 factor (ECF subfamily)